MNSIPFVYSFSLRFLLPSVELRLTEPKFVRLPVIPPAGRTTVRPSNLRLSSSRSGWLFCTASWSISSRMNMWRHQLLQLNPQWHSRDSIHSTHYHCARQSGAAKTCPYTRQTRCTARPLAHTHRQSMCLGPCQSTGQSPAAQTVDGVRFQYFFPMKILDETCWIDSSTLWHCVQFLSKVNIHANDTAKKGEN